MRRNRPGLVLVACLLGLFAGAVAPAGATDARVRALGGIADGFEDDSNALRWPGSLADYAGQADLGLAEIDADGATTASGHANVAFAENGRWGVLGLAFGDRLPEGERGGFFAAGYAHRLGPVEAALTFRGTTYGTAANPTGEGAFHVDTRYLHSWGIGARADLADGFYVDAAAELIRNELEYEDEALGIDLHDLSSDSHAWRLRGFARMSDRVVLVPHVAYSHEVRPTVHEALGGVADIAAWSVVAGLSCNGLLDPDNLVLVSLDYVSLQRDWTARFPSYATYDAGWRDMWQFVVRAGVESRVKPWLTVRAGVVYRRSTDESYLIEALDGVANDYDYRWDVAVAIPLTAGVGLHLGDFDADVAIHDASLLASDQLPAALERPGEGIVTAATLRYTF